MKYKTCPRCAGSGHWVEKDQKCYRCDGTGKVPDERGESSATQRD